MIRCQNNELHVCPHMCALHIQSQVTYVGLYAHAHGYNAVYEGVMGCLSSDGLPHGLLI